MEGVSNNNIKIEIPSSFMDLRDELAKLEKKRQELETRISIQRARMVVDAVRTRIKHMGIVEPFLKLSDHLKSIAGTKDNLIVTFEVSSDGNAGTYVVVVAVEIVLFNGIPCHQDSLGKTFLALSKMLSEKNVFDLYVAIEKKIEDIPLSGPPRDPRPAAAMEPVAKRSNLGSGSSSRSN